MSDPSAVGNEFVKYYYATFDSGRQNLAALYRPESMLTFEGQQFQGAENIVEKLAVSFVFLISNLFALTILSEPSFPEGSA